MNGKVKSLHGVYKALGRDAFLAAAKMYSDHVQKTVEATLAEMESHWYGAEKTMTEADRMVSDFQIGYLTRESAEGLLAQERLQEKFAKNMNAVLNNVHFVRLECSCMSPNKSYAGEVLKGECTVPLSKPTARIIWKKENLNLSIFLLLSVLGIPESCVWALSRLI